MKVDLDINVYNFKIFSFLFVIFYKNYLSIFAAKNIYEFNTFKPKKR